MDLPVVVIDMLVGYLDHRDLCEVRLLNRTWDAIVSPQLFRVMSIAGKPKKKELAKSLQRRGAACRVLTLRVSEDNFFLWTAAKFRLLSTLHSLRLFGQKGSLPGIAKTLQGMPRLKHVSVFNESHAFHFSSFDLVASRLTSLFLCENYRAFPALEGIHLTCLKSLIVSTRGSMLEVPNYLQTQFPVLRDLHVFFRTKQSDSTLLRADLQRQEVRCFGVCDKAKAAYFGLAFHEGEVPITADLNTAYGVLDAHFNSWDFLEEKSGLPRIQQLTIRSEGGICLDLLESWSGAESVVVRVASLDGVHPPQCKFLATRFKLTCDMPIEAFLVPWLAKHFPGLVALETNQPIPSHTLRGTLPHLQRFRGPEKSPASLKKLIKLAPNLSEMRVRLCAEKLAKLSKEYPAIHVSRGEFMPEANQDFEVACHGSLEG